MTTNKDCCDKCEVINWGQGAKNYGCHIPDCLCHTPTHSQKEGIKINGTQYTDEQLEQPTISSQKEENNNARELAQKIVQLTFYGGTLHVNDILPDIQSTIHTEVNKVLEEVIVWMSEIEHQDIELWRRIDGKIKDIRARINQQQTVSAPTPPVSE